VTRPGPIALVGSGEFLPVMRETDRHLIDQIGGLDAARVAVLPTASGLEPGMPEVWAQKGLDHFQSLGVPVRAVMIVEREDASSPEWVEALRDATFYYFSGGNPQYVIETLRGTVAWEVILSRHLAGAALAGCSAGAMMLGGATIHLRRVMAGAPIEWIRALEVVPGIGTIPHFDRVNRFIQPELLLQALAAAPAGLTVIGVDEDTALVRLEPPGAAESASHARWRVLGRQSVTVFDAADGEATVYPAGTEVPLEE
jgi:cyanophycinase